MDYRCCGLLLLMLIVFAEAGRIRRKRYVLPRIAQYASRTGARFAFAKSYGTAGNSDNGNSNNGNSNNGNNCNCNVPTNQGPPKTRTASCDMKPNPQFTGLGSVRGRVDLSETEGSGVTMAVSLAGFGLSNHALSVRAIGKMDAGCGDAGGVYNPSGTSPIGNLGRVSLNNQGQIRQTLASTDMTMFGDDSIVGRVISVASQADDGFMACCVVYRND